MKSGYNFPKANNIQFQCHRHESFLITHGCLFMDCSDQILLCSSCFLENLDHITHHQKYISTLPNFLNEFYINFSNAKENIGPLEKIPYSNSNTLKNWHKVLKEQKHALEKELNDIRQRFDRKIEQIKKNISHEMENGLKDIEMTYKSVEKILENSELLNFTSKSTEDFFQKIKNLNPSEREDFLIEMRNRLNLLKTPINSKITNNYIEYSKKLDTFLKSSKEIYSYKENFEKAFEILFNELSEKFRTSLQNFQAKEQNSLYKEFDGNFEITKTPIKILKSPSETPETISPLMNNISYNSYFPKRMIESDIKASQLIKSFRNMSKINKFDVFENPSQKNFLIKNDLFFTKNNLPKLELKMEAYFEEKINCSSLCLINLNESLFVAAGKDHFLRIFEISLTSNHKSSINLIKILQNLEDDSSVWCLAKLSPINHQKSDLGVFYFASGSENGIISVWKFDFRNTKISNTLNKPLIELIGNPMTEIITSILDLNDGNHLICGDSKGNIMIWDFLYGKLLNSFEIHRDQINSIIAFNNYQNLAIGSYDGNISLWEIINKEKIELKCIKIIKNSFKIYGLTSLYSRNGNILIVDSEKKLKILDIKKMFYLKESETLTNFEPLMDVLCIESYENPKIFPFILCFTTKQLIIFNGDTLDIIKTFDKRDLENNNIGATMNSNYKIVFLNKNLGLLEEKNQIYFGIVDQSPKTKRVLSVFKINF